MIHRLAPEEVRALRTADFGCSSEAVTARAFEWSLADLKRLPLEDLREHARLATEALRAGL